MPQAKDTTKRVLKASDVYQLVQDVLQEIFELDMENSLYEAQTIWDVLITAAVERLTSDSSCSLLEGAPSANTVRAALKQILDDEELEKLEAQVNALLLQRLPKNLLNHRLVCAVDYTDHGQHQADDERVRRGRAKSGRPTSIASGHWRLSSPTSAIRLPSPYFANRTKPTVA